MTTTAQTAALTPPHARYRATWADTCRYCDAGPGQPCRTKNGRPYIWDGTDHVTRSRASVLAKTTDDNANLVMWKQRLTAVGLLQRQGLMTRLAGVVALANGDLDAVKDDLNRICTEAFEAAGGSDKASAGTGFHALTEAIDAGVTLAHVPQADMDRVTAYATATAPYTAVASEVFVYCEELAVAGSFDRLWLCPDGRVRVGDLKSGKWDALYPTGAATQMAIYANSRVYDPTTGVLTDLDERIDRSTGLLVHMPPSGGCEVIPLDLEKGWFNARLAATVRDVRGWRADDLYKKVTW